MIRLINDSQRQSNLILLQGRHTRAKESVIVLIQISNREMKGLRLSVMKVSGSCSSFANDYWYELLFYFVIYTQDRLLGQGFVKNELLAKKNCDTSSKTCVREKSLPGILSPHFCHVSKNLSLSLFSFLHLKTCIICRLDMMLMLCCQDLS